MVNLRYLNHILEATLLCGCIKLYFLQRSITYSLETKVRQVQQEHCIQSRAEQNVSDWGTISDLLHIRQEVETSKYKARIIVVLTMLKSRLSVRWKIISHVCTKSMLWGLILFY